MWIFFMFIKTNLVTLIECTYVVIMYNIQSKHIISTLVDKYYTFFMCLDSIRFSVRKVINNKILVLSFFSLTFYSTFFNESKTN